MSLIDLMFDFMYYCLTNYYLTALLDLSKKILLI